jgi:hypothetical protein
MPNYKLTTDLITDLMVLIPQNLERLNKQQEVFGVKPPRPNKGHHKNYQNTILFDFHGDVVADVGYECDHEFYFGQSAIVDFILISQCLRIIPEFQEKCNLYLEMTKNWENDLHHWKEFWEGRIEKMPKTIASATLHGQGEFPPSTLVELCESYKNVINA